MNFCWTSKGNSIESASFIQSADMQLKQIILGALNNSISYQSNQGYWTTYKFTLLCNHFSQCSDYIELNITGSKSVIYTNLLRFCGFVCTWMHRSSGCKQELLIYMSKTTRATFAITSGCIYIYINVTYCRKGVFFSSRFKPPLVI